MDDILVLSPTCRCLRKAVKVLNQVFGSLRQEKQREKTFIGKIERGRHQKGGFESPYATRSLLYKLLLMGSSGLVVLFASQS
jgi:hypothetical protein